MHKLALDARPLGYAGLLPQAAFLLAVLKGGPAGWTALALAYAYAALIFSFLGGIWWGIAIARPETPRWALFVAVLPSLIALGLWFPWMVGWTWPGPQLVALGLCIALSHLVDRALWRGPPSGWLALRRSLSLGLGGLTIATGLLAL